MPLVGVDTNVFIRIFLDDGQAQHRAALRFAKAHRRIFVGSVVLAETVWALRSIFQWKKEDILRFVSAVLDTDAFEFENRQALEAALFAYSEGTAHFADYLILETARTNGVDALYTFDSRFGKAEGVVMLK